MVGEWSGSLDLWFTAVKALWMWLCSFKTNKWTTERKRMPILILWTCVFIFSEHSRGKVKWKKMQFPVVNFTLKWCEVQLIFAWFPQISVFNLNPQMVTKKKVWQFTCSTGRNCVSSQLARVSLCVACKSKGNKGHIKLCMCDLLKGFIVPTVKNSPVNFLGSTRCLTFL